MANTVQQDIGKLLTKVVNSEAKLVHTALDILNGQKEIKEIKKNSTMNLQESLQDKTFINRAKELRNKVAKNIKDRVDKATVRIGQGSSAMSLATQSPELVNLAGNIYVSNKDKKTSITSYLLNNGILSEVAKLDEKDVATVTEKILSHKVIKNIKKNSLNLSYLNDEQIKDTVLATHTVLKKMDEKQLTLLSGDLSRATEILSDLKKNRKAQFLQEHEKESLEKEQKTLNNSISANLLDAGVVSTIANLPTAECNNLLDAALNSPAAKEILADVDTKKAKKFSIIALDTIKYIDSQPGGTVSQFEKLASKRINISNKLKAEGLSEDNKKKLKEVQKDNISAFKANAVEALRQLSSSPDHVSIIKDCLNNNKDFINHSLKSVIATNTKLDKMLEKLNIPETKFTKMLDNALTTDGIKSISNCLENPSAANITKVVIKTKAVKLACKIAYKACVAKISGEKLFDLQNDKENTKEQSDSMRKGLEAKTAQAVVSSNSNLPNNKISQKSQRQAI
jgi:hypothetical protein